MEFKLKEPLSFIRGKKNSEGEIVNDILEGTANSKNGAYELVSGTYKQIISKKQYDAIGDANIRNDKASGGSKPSTSSGNGGGSNQGGDEKAKRFDDLSSLNKKDLSDIASDIEGYDVSMKKADIIDIILDAEFSE